MSLGIKNGKNGTGHQQKMDDSYPVETAVSPHATSRMPAPLIQGCPYFGSMDDPETRFLFASPAGSCHRARPADYISLAHQQEFCLSARHQTCPVFQQANPGPLPASLRAEHVGGTNRSWRWGLLAVLVVVTIILLLVWRFPGAPLPTPVMMAASAATATPSPTAPSATTTTEPILPTEMAVVAVVATAVPSPTSTPQPTATPTPTNTAVPTPTVKPTLPATFTPSPVTEPTLPPVRLSPTAVPRIIVGVPVLNVRQGPGTEYPVIGSIEQNGQYEVVGRSYNGGWWQLCCVAGEPGWVIGEAVTIEGDTASVPIVSIAPAEEANP